MNKEMTPIMLIGSMKCGTSTLYHHLIKHPKICGGKIEKEPALTAITRRQPAYVYKDNRFFIWGLTASILVHLSNLLYSQQQPLGELIKK